MNQSNNIFVSYSHEDEHWLKQLLVMLKPATRNGAITLWADTQISPGAQWREDIRTALDQANIAVLLVSQNFIASDFIAMHEFPFLLSAAEKRGLVILWLAITSCVFEMTEIGGYQPLNDPFKPLDSLSTADRNRELADIARKIVTTVKERKIAECEGSPANQKVSGNHNSSKGPPTLSMDEKLLRTSRDRGAKIIISRLSSETLGVYGSSSKDVMQSGRISRRKPPPAVERAAGEVHASMNLAGLLIAKAVRSNRKIPDDVWPEIFDLPGIEIDRSSFIIDGYDVIYRTWVATGSGHNKEIWARVGSSTPSGSTSLEAKLMDAMRSIETHDEASIPVILTSEQERAIEEAIRAGTFQTFGEFIDAAIATLPTTFPNQPPIALRKSRLWELREGSNLGDLAIGELIEEGRE